MKRKTKQTEEIGREPDRGEASPPSGSERALDEQRTDGGPRYGGDAWEVADARGDSRFGKARNDDADPLEMMRPGEDIERGAGDEVIPSAPAEHQSRAQANEEDDVTFSDMQRATSGEDIPHIESGGEMAGMGRGEKPRKLKSRSRR